MKKLLAVVLAAATVLSLGVTAFAASATKAAKATFTTATITVTNGTAADAIVTKGDLTMTQILKKSGGTPAGTLVFKSTNDLAATSTAATVAGALNGATATTTLNGKSFTFKLSAAAAVLTMSVESEGDTGLMIGAAMDAPTFTFPAGNAGVATGTAVTFATAGVDASYGDAPANIVAINNPLVESIGDLTGEAHGTSVDSIKSGKALYYAVNSPFDETENFELTVKKGDNAKAIKKISIVEKSGSFYQVSDGTKVGGTRETYVKIEFNENYTDSDYKITFDLSAKAKADVYGFKKGDKTGKYEDVTKFWMQNRTEDADQDYNAGEGGLMLKPVKNEDNEITWSDENNVLATLTFVADSDTAKFFPKLSTKWENADYAEYFADQNAFYFDWTGYTHEATKISSTSRATLEIYNPYYDEENDELTIDPEDVIIYSVDVDGTFTDVTDSFKASENDDGDYVFTTKTRELGTYIFAEKVAGTVVDDVVETPDDGKVIPNTGR